MTITRDAAGPEDPPTDELLGQVARLFFDGRLTKVEIAARLGISRFRVARLLDQALDDGVVRIEFRDARAEDRAAGRELEARFGFRRCVVVEADDDAGLARGAADVLDGLLDPGAQIGLAWGSTVGRVVRAMAGRTDRAIDVVQLAGSSTGFDAGIDPGDLTLVLAERLGGRQHRIHAPAFVESAELRLALLRQPEIAATVARFDSLSVALIGIGAFAGSDGVPSSSLLRSGALEPADREALVGLGAVGDLLVHPFTSEGTFVAPDISARSVAISIDQLRRVPTVVAVAAGAIKVAAIGGALATGVIDVLVTDARTAAALSAIVPNPARDAGRAAAR